MRFPRIIAKFVDKLLISASTYVDVGEIIYEPRIQALGVGDGTGNPPLCLMENKEQQVTNKIIDDRENSIKNVVPVGSLILFSSIMEQDPRWLLCNGATNILREEYSALYLLYAANNFPYGAGNGETTFSIPDQADFGFIPPNCNWYVRANP